MRYFKQDTIRRRHHDKTVTLKPQPNLTPAPPLLPFLINPFLRKVPAQAAARGEVYPIVSHPPCLSSLPPKLSVHQQLISSTIICALLLFFQGPLRGQIFCRFCTARVDARFRRGRAAVTRTQRSALSMHSLFACAFVLLALVC